MPKQTTDPKSFSLKEHETNLLTFTRSHSEAIFSGILSTIAMDRLSYKVTDRTKFQLNGDLTEMSLEELPEEIPEESPVTAAK